MNKKLTILIYVIAIATLALIVLVGFLSIQHRDDISKLRLEINSINKLEQVTPKDGYNPVKGVDYFDGKSIKGEKGDDGKDSISTHTVETIVKEVPIKGDRGDNGNPGKSLEIKVDPTYCILMTRYQGDDSWELQAQLPTPCEVL